VPLIVGILRTTSHVRLLNIYLVWIFATNQTTIKISGHIVGNAFEKITAVIS